MMYRMMLSPSSVCFFMEICLSEKNSKRVCHICGSLIPVRAFGIPGESVTAVMMGDLLIRKLQPDLICLRSMQGYLYFFAGFVLVRFFMLGLAAAAR